MEFSEIINRLDFRELVSRRVKLSNSGKNRYRGLSPFTNEKTPSFYVDGESKTWYCFSSGQGGGVLDYVMESESLDKAGAIQFLKEYLNITDEDDDADTSRSVKIKRALVKVNEYFLIYQNRAIDYLIERGMDKGTATHVAKKYRIGFCPKDSNIKEVLNGQGVSTKLLRDAGVFYDSSTCRYENRITIPIKNEYGQVISFTGRDVTGEARSKYMHGTTSIVFKKNEVAWNLSSIRKMVEEHDLIVVCEGQMDAIAVTEAGIPAVSIMGSKISESQLKAISRMANNIYMVFDSDRAGQDGLMSAFKMISDLDLDSVVYSLVIPGAKDPDDFIKENGDIGFQRLVEESKPDTSHLVQILLKKNLEKGHAKSKASIIRKILSDLEPYMKKAYTYRSLDLIERLSQELGLSRRELQSWIDSGTKFSSTKKNLEKINDIQFPAPVYERRLLYLILKDPTLMYKFRAANVSPYDFESQLVSKIIENIEPSLSTNEVLDKLKESLSAEDYNLVVAFLSQGLLEADFDTALDILKAKTQFRTKKAKTDFLGRPINSTEVEFKRVVGDVINYGKEPF